VTVTFNMLREAALKLPSVADSRSYGTPSLMVGKTIIARLREDGETLVLKLDPFERDVLLETQPDAFFCHRSLPRVSARPRQPWKGQFRTYRDFAQAGVICRRTKATDRTLP